MDSKDARLVECMRLLEETGDLERCLELYPDLSQELREHDGAARSLSALAPPSPLPESANSSRRLLLSSLAENPGGTPMWQRFVSNKAAALAAAAALFVLGTVGAGAATGSPFAQPVNDVLGNLGVGGDHGKDVSEKVHDAIENTEPGPERGREVSKAACEAAHNRDTLPDGAQAAPGQQDKDAKECDDEELLGEDEEEGDIEPLDHEDGNHGQHVSEGVHEAIDSTEPGEERGRAVSQAACENAHDPSTLPPGAQDAPGRENKPEKDCEHPNAENE